MEIDPPHAVDVIASGIHDVKNGMFDALARIGSATQSIRAGEPALALPLLAETEQAVAAAGERLSKLLSAYRLARHENPVAMVPVDVCALVEDVLIRCNANPHGLELRSNCSCDEPWICDRELVADSLVNAVQNALRHARTTVQVDAAVTDGWLSLTVTDDGPGFPAELPAHADGTRAGVGLYIARRIAQLHVRRGRHGNLTLDNDSAGGGAVFRLTLP